MAGELVLVEQRVEPLVRQQVLVQVQQQLVLVQVQRVEPLVQLQELVQEQQLAWPTRHRSRRQR